MNFREGMRRLSLAAGIFGALAGATIGYLKAEPLFEQRRQHADFETLLHTPAVQQEIENTRKKSQDSRNSSWLDSLSNTLGWRSGQAVDRDGVNKVYLDREGQVNSISASDGRKLYPIREPSVGSYLKITAWPILGFIIPWSALKVLTWIGSGFLEHA